MMTTEEAQAYLQKMHEAEGTEEPKTEPTEPETNPTDPQSVQGDEGEEEDVTHDDGDGRNRGGDDGDAGGKPSETKTPSSPKGGETGGDGDDALEKNKQRWAESFRREKDKRKKQKLSYESAIARLERENAELKKKLGDVDSEDFKVDNRNLSDIVKLRTNESEAERLKEERERVMMEDDVAENERRVATCFPDEADREIYNRLLKNSGTAFVERLDAEDPDGVILGCLDDCDISPIVLRVMMTKPQFLNEILSKKTRHGKEIAFDNLVNRCRIADKVIKSKKASQKTKPEGTEAKEEPQPKGLNGIKPTGRQAKANTDGGGEIRKDSSYWENYLKTHPRGY
jgi:hypothetical protein